MKTKNERTTKRVRPAKKPISTPVKSGKRGTEDTDLGEDTTMKEREEEQKRPAPREEL